jgi:glycosyltransferase involved in cell wall biosynthesis
MSKPGRVLLTTDAVGGVWRYTLDLAHGLTALGVACEIAVLGPSPSSAQSADAAAFALHDTGAALDWTAPDETALSDAAAAVLDLARTRGVDVLHLHTPALARFSDVPTVAVAHSCVATWWRAVHDGALPDDLAWRRAAVARGLRAADAVIAPTAAFAAALEAEYAPGRPILAVHNGIAPREPAPWPRTRAVLAAGRLWDEGKNVEILDAAAPLLDAPVLAAGSLAAPHGGQFAPLGLTPLGELSAAALATRMEQTQLFASPARYEPFGLAVLEAASAGCALVLGDIPTARELWDGAAVFVDPLDLAAWVTTLQRLLDDPVLCARLGAVAASRAGRYTRATTARATMDVYRTVPCRAPTTMAAD